MEDFYRSPFISIEQHRILSAFLFSCYTGFRISDTYSLTPDNIVDDNLVFTAKKTGKFHRIRLPKTAMYFFNTENTMLFYPYAEQHINRQLKVMANQVGLRKTISFYVARHTSDTNKFCIV